MANSWAKKVQFGLETTAGTAVAADTIFVCEHPRLVPDRQPEIIEEDIGVRVKGRRAVFYQYLVENSLRFPDAYFQALPALFSCGLVGSVSPAEQTPAQADYLWAFTPSLTGANSVDSMTMEFGDDTQAYEVEYCQFTRFRISGRIAQDGGPSPVTVEADFYGRQNTATTFTGALSLPSQEPINAKRARLYRDTAWAGVGGTEITNIVRSFDIEIMTGMHHKALGGSSLYFNTVGQGDVAAMAQFTLERGSTSDAIWDIQQAGSLSVVRLLIEGAQIGTGDNHSLSIDIGGVWKDVVPLSEEDRGNAIDAGVIEAYYDGTGAKAFQVNVTTNVSAV